MEKLLRKIEEFKLGYDQTYIDLGVQSLQDTDSVRMERAKNRYRALTLKTAWVYLERYLREQINEFESDNQKVESVYEFARILDLSQDSRKPIDYVLVPKIKRHRILKNYIKILNDTLGMGENDRDRIIAYCDGLGLYNVVF